MGTWTIEIEYEGEIYEYSFRVDYEPQLTILDDFIFNESIGDQDMVINPGEVISVVATISNYSNYDALSIDGSIECENENLSLENFEIYYDLISNGETISNIDQPFVISIPEDMDLVGIDCNINLNYLSEVGLEYEASSSFTFTISLNQYGFPYQDAGQIVSTPLVIDIDQDGDNEIIFGDYDGKIRAYKK